MTACNYKLFILNNVYVITSIDILYYVLDHFNIYCNYVHVNMLFVLSLLSHILIKVEMANGKLKMNSMYIYL